MVTDVNKKKTLEWVFSDNCVLFKCCNVVQMFFFRIVLAWVEPYQELTGTKQKIFYYCKRLSNCQKQDIFIPRDNPWFVTRLEQERVCLSVRLFGGDTQLNVRVALYSLGKVQLHMKVR